jgi:predicted double-glycine peptidase
MVHVDRSVRLKSVCLSAAAVLFSSTAANLALASPGTVRSLLEIRHENVVVQQWDMSCGAAALATVLTYQLGDRVAEKQVAQGMLRRTDPMRVRHRGGFSLLDMKRYAESRGFKAEGYSGLELEDLRQLAPLIVPVKLQGYDHFVIFRGAVGTVAVLADPAFGNRKLPLEEFKRVWNGNLGFVVRSPEQSLPANRMRPRQLDLLAVADEAVLAALDSELPLPLQDWQMADLPRLGGGNPTGQPIDNTTAGNPLTDGDADQIVATGPNPINHTVNDLPASTRPGPVVSPVGSTTAPTSAIAPISTAAPTVAAAATPVSTVAQTIVPTVTTVTSAAAPVVAAVTTPVSAVVAPVTQTVNTVASTAAPVVSTVTAPVSTVVQTVAPSVNTVTTAAAPVVAAVTAPVSAVVAPVTQTVNTVASAAAPVVSTVTAPVSTVVQTVAPTVHTVTTAAAPVVAAVTAPVSTAVAPVTQTVNTVASTAAPVVAAATAPVSTVAKTVAPTVNTATTAVAPVVTAVAPGSTAVAPVTQTLNTVVPGTAAAISPGGNAASKAPVSTPSVTAPLSLPAAVTVPTSVLGGLIHH